jgi:hypothetical protein
MTRKPKRPPEVDAAVRARLHEAVNKFTGGNTDAFARMIGYLNGGFLRELLAGNKPVRNAIVRRFEAVPELRGWFEGYVPDAAPPHNTYAADAQRIADTFSLIPTLSAAQADSRHQLYIDIMAMLNARVAAGPATARPLQLRTQPKKTPPQDR